MAAVPNDGKWHHVQTGHDPVKRLHFTKWHAIHPETGEVVVKYRTGFPGGKKLPRQCKHPPEEAPKFMGKAGEKPAVSVSQVSAVAREPKPEEREPTTTKWTYEFPKGQSPVLKSLVVGDDVGPALKNPESTWSKYLAKFKAGVVSKDLTKNESRAALIEAINGMGLQRVIQEIAWAEPKVKGAMVYVPHKAFYDWRDGKGDKDPADMKVTKGYLETMAGEHGRVHPHTFTHPHTGEPHHAVEFRDANHAADFIDKLKTAGVKGDIPWHHTGE